MYVGDIQPFLSEGKRFSNRTELVFEKSTCCMKVLMDLMVVEENMWELLDLRLKTNIQYP
jgi:hypothetical protein